MTRNFTANKKVDFMQKNIAILAVLGTVTLTACGGKTDVNEKNFGAAISQYLDKKGDLCLAARPWPVDLTERDLSLQKTFQEGDAGQMAALEAAGLVKGEDADKVRLDYSGMPTDRKEKIKRYTLTDAAKPFAQESVDDSYTISTKPIKTTALCWGKKSLDKVVKWVGPMKLGDYQRAGIHYTYKITNLAGWAKKPEVQAAFPNVKFILDGAGKKETTLDVTLTSQGWEAAAN